MKYYIITFLIIGAVILQINITFAHPGNTDASGGHTCRTNCASWGLFTGQYHYHGGSSYYDDIDEEEDNPYYYQPPKTQIPEYLIKGVTASITPQLIDNGVGCGYDVDIQIDSPGITGTIRTSLTRSNKDIANQVGRVSTYRGFTPGQWYLNVEVSSREYDLPSSLYWDVNLLEVVPSREVKLGTNDMITYNLKCIKVVTSTNETLQNNITLSRNNEDGSSTATFEASGVYGRQEVVVTDYYGKTYTSVLDFPDTKSLAADISLTEDIEDDGESFIWVIALFIIGIIIFAIGATRSDS